MVNIDNVSEYVDPDDRELASLLMAVAFPDEPHAESRRGMGPLYLLQAYTLRRNPEMHSKLVNLLSRGCVTN